jgi:hypothetical protein
MPGGKASTRSKPSDALARTKGTLAGGADHDRPRQTGGSAAVHDPPAQARDSDPPTFGEAAQFVAPAN